MSETALIVVDMVFDFTHPEGKVFYPRNREIIPRIKDPPRLFPEQGYDGDFHAAPLSPRHAGEES